MYKELQGKIIVTLSGVTGYMWYDKHCDNRQYLQYMNIRTTKLLVCDITKNAFRKYMYSKFECAIPLLFCELFSFH